MKKIDLIFASITVPLDWCMILAASTAAYFLRFQTLVAYRPIIYQMPFERFIIMAVIGATALVVFFALSGLYTIRARKIHNEIQRIITSCSSGMMLFIVGIFFLQEYFSSRFVIVMAWLLMIIFLSVGRGLLRYVRVQLFRYDIGIVRCALIGANERTAFLASYLTQHPQLGLKPVIRYEKFDDATQKHISTLCQSRQLDEIMVLCNGNEGNELDAILQCALFNHLDVRYSANTFGVKRYELSQVAGIPFIDVKRTRLDGWMRILKRVFDIFASFLLCIVFAPVMLMIALFIKLQSRGPVIYKDIRVGQRGTFITYKFRTMFIEYCTGPAYDKKGDAEKLHDQLIEKYNERRGPVPKVPNDPRRTPLGRILEKTSLDELPQFFNVLIGTMSLVGPRPHRPREVMGYDIKHHQLFSVKPGVTGLAQISGRSDLDFDDEVRLDLLYIENWSPWLDLVILLKTPFAVLTRKSFA